MITANDVYKFIDSFAPWNTQLSFDNAGLLVGSGTTSVSKIGFCLDITNDTIIDAENNGVDLIISHHPIIFNKLANIPENSAVYNLIKKDMCAICAHTNYDIAEIGVNFNLFNSLSLCSEHKIDYDDDLGLLRVGELENSMEISDFANFVKTSLNSPDVRYSQTDNDIKVVAVCGGAGSDQLYIANEVGADVLVTSEIKHHEWLYAKQIGIAMIDAGHFSTEVIAVKPLMDKIQSHFGNKIECVLLSENPPYKAV